MKKVAACLFVVFFVLVLFPALPVQADIAPPPAPHGGDILPESQATKVRMVAEKVLIEALPNASGQVPVGRVSADFQMRNMGDKDEAMTVRFPLNIIYVDDVCAVLSDFKPVQNFQAWINDQPASITIDRRIPGNGFPWSKEQDCWAYFPAIFPVGKDVQIRVSYTQEAGPSANNIKAFVTYPYVLLTGAGWYDTIGSVDITFRAPWELNKDNLISWEPTQGQVLGNEVHWQFKDFEPNDHQDNINVTIVNPAVWRELVRGRKDTAANPQDGESWGRLGKALKEMTISTHRGIYREDYYRESYAAYQKAIELKPWDADWHFGFAELLYNQVVLNTLSGPALTDDFRRDCITQLKAALDINPRHEQARKFLYYNFGVDENRLGQEVTQEWIPKYGLEAYFLSISTEMHATQTQMAIHSETEVATYYPTDTPTPSVTPQPSQTLAPKLSAIAPSLSPIVIAKSGKTTTPSPTQIPTTNHPSRGVCGSIIIPLIIAVGFWLKRLKIIFA